MKSFIVLYTSTETLYDEAKERKQSSMIIRARNEEDAKQKVVDKLNASGQHSRIVVHEVKLDGNAAPRMSRWMIIVMGALLIFFLFSFFRGN